jgi:NitT/TauT family transport system permease protein
MGKKEGINLFFNPILYMSYPIPKLALLPILMLLLGLGESSKILLLFLIIFPQVTLSIRDAVKNIDAGSSEIYRLMRATHIQKLRLITLPATLPALFSSIRISIGIAISVLFFSETYGTTWGMGYFIMDMWGRMDYVRMYAGIFILSFFGFLIFLLIDGVSKKKLDYIQK